MEEIKSKIDEIGHVFHEFKKANDERLEKIEKGTNTQELENKTNKITEDVTLLCDQVQKLQSVTNQETKDGNGVDYKSVEYNNAVKSYILKNDMSGLETKALQTRIDTDGGFLVAPEIDTEIAKRFIETSPMRQLATVKTLNSGNQLDKYVRTGLVASGGWTGELSSNQDSDTGKYSKVSIFAHKHYTMPPVSEEYLADVSSVESELLSEAQGVLTREENTAFVAGSGSGQPKGILSYTAGGSSYTFNALEQVNSGGASSVTVDGLIDLQNSLYEVYQGNAAFMMARSTFGALMKLKGTDVYFFGGNQQGAGSPISLLGKPVVFASDMPAVAAGALAIAYGDFRAGYTIVDKAGTSILRDPYTNPGQVKYRVTRRTGGAVTDFDAIKLQKIAS